MCAIIIIEILEQKVVAAVQCVWKYATGRKLSPFWHIHSLHFAQRLSLGVNSVYMYKDQVQTFACEEINITFLFFFDSLFLLVIEYFWNRVSTSLSPSSQFCSLSAWQIWCKSFHRAQIRLIYVSICRILLARSQSHITTCVISKKLIDY